MPQPSVGFSLQSLPLAGIAFTPLSAACSLTVIHQRAWRGYLDLITAGFGDRRAFGAPACFPPTTMSSLFTRPKTRFPVTPDPNNETANVPPASSVSKLYSSRESVHADPSCPEPSGRSSPGFMPL